MQRHHHGIDAEVYSPWSPRTTVLYVLALLLGFGAATGSTLSFTGSVPLSALVMIFGVLTTAATLFTRTRSISIKISDEYLTIETKSLLQKTRIKRLALRAIEEVSVQPDAPGLPSGSIQLTARGFGTFHVPCSSFDEATRLVAHIEEAIATAPGPHLRKTARTPEELEQMRGATREQAR